MIEPLSRSRAALLLIDFQDRLAAAMPPDVLAQITRNARILIEAARRLGMPIIATQQYPKGLGPTIAPIEEALAGAPALHRFDKLEFAATGCAALAALLPKLARDQWIVTGMETHVCVYQTARALVARGYAAHVAVDACASRTKASWKIGKSLCKQSGAIVSSTEATVLDLVGAAGSEDFKALSRAIK